MHMHNTDMHNTDMHNTDMHNTEIADILDRVADLLEAQQADTFRVRAYRGGARTCRGLERPLVSLLEEEDLKGLERLPNIGKSLAASIAECVHTGRLRQLERLEGELSPEHLFTTLPGIGEEFSHRIHEVLGVETLPELEVAAHDGRLAGVPGIGERRVHAIRDSLAAILGPAGRRRGRRMRPTGGPERPSVTAILEVDAEYRRLATTSRLRRIAPRRFNPSGEAWLPIYHTAREAWYFTAMYSNSARAHELETTDDWVVILFERDGVDGQCTVVTECRGPLTGHRVIRGREAEQHRFQDRPGEAACASAAG